jgi:hypothetical protein
MLTHPQAKRVKTVAVGVALASWGLPIAIALLAFAPTRQFAFVALAFFAACLAASLLLGWSLFCPWCCKHLFFVASMANSPSFGQLLRQYVPYEIVVESRLSCPHCHACFALSRT